MANSKPLAATSFMSEPDDNLATADVYEINNDDIINNLPKMDSAVVDAQTKMLEDGMRGGAAMAEGLPLKKDSLLAGVHALQDKAAAKSSLFSVSNAKMILGESMKAAAGVLNIAGMGNFTGPSLLSTISKGGLSALPGVPNNALKNITSAVANNQIPGSLKSVLSLPTGNTLGTYVTTGTQALRIATGDKGAVTQLLGTLSALSPSNNIGRPQMEDKDGAMRLLTGLATTGLQLGVVNTFSQATSIANGSKAVLTQAATLALKSAAGFGSVGGMKDITSTYSGMFGSSSTLFASNPNVMTELTSNYKKPLPIGTTVYNGPSVNPEFTDTLEVFDNLNPSWRSSNRVIPDPGAPGSSVTEASLNLSAVASANTDFSAMFNQGIKQSPDTGDESSVKFMALATQASKLTPEEQLKANFPQTVTSIQSNTTVDQQKIDPELLAISRKRSITTAEYKRLQGTPLGGYKGMIWDD